MIVNYHLLIVISLYPLFMDILLAKRKKIFRGMNENAGKLILFSPCHTVKAV